MGKKGRIKAHLIFFEKIVLLDIPKDILKEELFWFSIPSSMSGKIPTPTLLSKALLTDEIA